jgi:hypothetical protein
LFVSNVKKQNANHDLIQSAQDVFRLCASLSPQMWMVKRIIERYELNRDLDMKTQSGEGFD